MRPLTWLVLTLLSLLCVAFPAAATVATIETAAPLSDHSDQAIKATITQVMQNVAKGALAMGLSWVQVNRVLVLADSVNVRVLATDIKPANETEPEGDQDGGPLEPKPEAGPETDLGGPRWLGVGDWLLTAVESTRERGHASKASHAR